MLLEPLDVGRRQSRAVRLALVIWMGVTWACGEGRADSATIAPPELYDRIESGSAPLLLDVRGPWEFRSGHIPRALNIPYPELAERVGELDFWREREVVIYGEGGAQADAAAQLLRREGFDRTFRLVGDMPAWRRNGLPEER